MSRIALRLGPLKADGYRIVRSGIRWLCAPGETVRANQPIAYCNISLAPARAWADASPFAEERELHVALAPRVGGRLAINDDAVRGGYLSIVSVEPWDEDDVIAHLDSDHPEDTANPGCLRLLMLAGQRMTGLASVHSGLLAGWHGRTRGWWCEAGETPATLLSLGICDVTGVVTGARGAFLESFEAARRPAQMVFVPDQPVTPTAQILLDQMTRGPTQARELTADLHAHLTDAPATPDDLMFAGTLLQVMQRSPIQSPYAIYSADGLKKLGPADAILLSLNAEPQVILRHRKLGYHLHVMQHHQTAAGPVVRRWLAGAFEPVKRSIDDMKRDYEALIDAIARTTGARVMIVNRVSTQGQEDIASYAPFDAPMSETLANVASKEMNLMLHDLAEDRDLAIIDVDAMAAEIGGGRHVPDNIHYSGVMQAMIRSEILHVLDEVATMGRVGHNSLKTARLM